MAIKTKIVGVTFGNRQNVIGALDAGETLHLRDMADDRFPEAIGVFTSYGEQCGSIKSELATSIRKQYSDFEQLDVTVLQVTGGNDGMSFGCNIEIDGDGEIEHYTPNVRASATKAAWPAAKKKDLKAKTVVSIVVLAIAVLCAAVAIYALQTNQNDGAIKAGAASLVLFIAAALMLLRKRRK